MSNKFKRNIVNCLFMLLVSITVAACGGGSSSTSTTIPGAETIYFAHNLIFRNSTTLSTGYNAFGQLATGNLGGRSVPGALVQYYPFKGFAAGGNHSVAFLNNSTVRSWGYNAFGQLGIGNNTTTHSVSPLKTVAISGVIAVAAGAHHSLALRNDDTLWAWGSNRQSQLGVGSSLVPADSYIPVKVGAATIGAPFTNISSIAANSYNSIARANGLVWTWGFNGSGQLGISKDTGSRAAPNVVSGLPLTGISAIAAGGAFNYAVSRADGSVWAWGGNDNGQLGNGTAASSFTPVQVMKDAVTPLTGVVQVAAGIQHGLARLSDGSVWAWGYNFYGQLGNNDIKDSPFAVQVVKDVSPLTFLTGVADIRAFGSSSMAMIGGIWYVWGDNSYGQLGVASSKVAIPEKMSGF